MLKMNDFSKKFLFSLIVILVILTTIYIITTTIINNINSYSRGNVHWHADFEIWGCNQKIDLKDPKGLLNRIGTPLLHEHNDYRIHVEGVVKEKLDVRLANFFEVINGKLNTSTLTIPTNEGFITKLNGELCNGIPGKVQVFVYRIVNPQDYKAWRYEQEKIIDFENYVLSHHSKVPPGDCIIIEFSPEKTRTEYICETYRIAIEKGELSGS